MGWTWAKAFSSHPSAANNLVRKTGKGLLNSCHHLQMWILRLLEPVYVVQGMMLEVRL